MTGFKTHLFICTNSPDRSSKCGGKGAEKLRKEVKEACKEKYGKSIRINSSGCLGYCEHGIAAVMYPRGEWFLELEKDDSKTLIKAVDQAMTIQSDK